MTGVASIPRGVGTELVGGNLARWLMVLACAWPAAYTHADALFDALDVVDVRLTAPLRALSHDRDAEPEYRAGILTYTRADGRVVELAVKIRPRGNSRRDRHVCDFPPLLLNFSKSQVRGTLFDGQDKLKLVTHCRKSARYAGNVYKEYLAYRMLNQVTDASFRVRALRVEYVEGERKGRSESHFAFFIEDKHRLARRLHLKVVAPGRIDPAALEASQTSLMELFQFMIGNTDFSFIAPSSGDHCCHNAVLMQDAQGSYLPMPYDFDISGFVNPPYAVVDGRLPIANVRQRVFRGFCRDSETMLAAVERFRAARPSIVDVLGTETPLRRPERAAARRYVDEFFTVLDDSAQRQRRILTACRG